MAEEQQEMPGEVSQEAPPSEPLLERSEEEEQAGPSGEDGRETAPDAPTSELGEHAYKGELQQPRRPPDDE